MIHCINSKCKTLQTPIIYFRLYLDMKTNHIDRNCTICSSLVHVSNVNVCRKYYYLLMLNTVYVYIPSGQLSKTCCAISPAESLGLKRNSFVFPLTRISRRFICNTKNNFHIILHINKTFLCMYILQSHLFIDFLCI